jgi:hypothetical protein
MASDLSATLSTPAPLPQQQPQQPKQTPLAVWNVMVFMGAQRVDGDADLAGAARADLKEMRAAFGDSASDSLNVFVEMRGKNGEASRYRFGKDGEIPVPDAPAEAVDEALIEFMHWAFTEIDKMPYEPKREMHSMLVLWGHAYEFAIGRSQGQGGIDALDFAELSKVLDRLPKSLDIIGFDACDLSTVEMAYQLRGRAEYLLASEIGIPMPGWPYHRIFKRLREPFGRQLGAAELGSYIVRRYCESYQADKATVSLTLLHLALAEDVKELTAKLARRLAIAIAEDPEERNRVYDVFLRSQTIEDKPFVDAADLCLNLLRESSDIAVRAVAEELGDFLIAPGPVTPGKSASGEGRAFIVEHGRNACRTAKLQGVSLYAPQVTMSDVDSAFEFYDKLDFTREKGEKKTLWKELVRALAQASS